MPSMMPELWFTFADAPHHCRVSVPNYTACWWWLRHMSVNNLPT